MRKLKGILSFIYRVSLLILDCWGLGLLWVHVNRLLHLFKTSLQLTDDLLCLLLILHRKLWDVNRGWVMRDGFRLALRTDNFGSMLCWSGLGGICLLFLKGFGLKLQGLLSYFIAHFKQTVILDFEGNTELLRLHLADELGEFRVWIERGLVVSHLHRLICFGILRLLSVRSSVFRYIKNRGVELVRSSDRHWCVLRSVLCALNRASFLSRSSRVDGDESVPAVLDEFLVKEVLDWVHVALVCARACSVVIAGVHALRMTFWFAYLLDESLLNSLSASRLVWKLLPLEVGLNFIFGNVGKNLLMKFFLFGLLFGAFPLCIFKMMSHDLGLVEIVSRILPNKLLFEKLLERVLLKVEVGWGWNNIRQQTLSNKPLISTFVRPWRAHTLYNLACKGVLLFWISLCRLLLRLCGYGQVLVPVPRGEMLCFGFCRCSLAVWNKSVEELYGLLRVCS